MPPESTSLAIFTQASKMLAEADTFQKVKEFKSLALTAADWAKHKGMGQEAVRLATSYATRAEIKLGEMLAATERSDGGRPKKTGNATLPVSDAPSLASLGITKNESAQAQKLAALPEPVQNEVIEGKKTKTEVLSKKAHVAHSSGENEWYTPPEYIAAAYAVMGGIDLDPASSKIANKTVKAARYFAKDDSGLEKPWAGRVFMNPPYSVNLTKLFVEKFSAHIADGGITAGIVLVNNATETTWFRVLAECANAIVFMTGRIKFIDMDGNSNGSPLQGQAFLYFGKAPKKFLAEFGKFGWGVFM